MATTTTMEIRNSRGAGGAKCKGVAGEEEEDTATALRTACCHCCLAFTAIEKGRGAERRVAADHTHPHTHPQQQQRSGAEERRVAEIAAATGKWVGWWGGGPSSSAASHMLYVARDNVRGRGCRTRAKTERFLGAFVRSTGGVACAAVAVMSERSTCGTVAGSRADQAGGGWMDGWTDQTGWLARPPMRDN
uniref:Uncharacterized protein n=1 Tax=Oryza glumipatula TaxID=40148 RepID=A0A0E0AD70_9ORYZ